MDNLNTRTMYQEEELYPYLTGALIPPTGSVWSLSGARIFPDSANFLLSENSAGFEYDENLDILFQILPKSLETAHDNLGDTNILEEPTFAVEIDSLLHAVGIDEAYGYNAVAGVPNESRVAKEEIRVPLFTPQYDFNPDFLSNDDGNGGSFGSEKITEVKTEITNFDFSNHFKNSSYPETISSNERQKNNELNKSHELFVDLANWKSLDRTEHPSEEHRSRDNPSLSQLPYTSSSLACETGLSSDALQESRYTTPELSHSSNESITPKNAQAGKQFLSMRDIEVLSLPDGHIDEENRPKSVPNFLSSSFGQLLSQSTGSQPQTVQTARTKANWSSPHHFNHNGSSLNAESFAARSISISRRKKQRIEPKLIPSRFKVRPGYNITLQSSVVKCLDVTLNYHGYEGIIREITLNNSITNYFRNSNNDRLIKPAEMKEPLFIKYELLPGERIEYDWGSEDGDRKVPQIHCHMGVVQRKIYVRDISEIYDLVTHIRYHKSPNFNINNPYEPQYTRFETDEAGVENNETKCGLCAYCREVRFLPFKNSSYLSHMTLGHGIFADNFIVPEGINFGKYIVQRDKDSEPDKTKEIEGLQCPACLEIVEMSCWSTKENPLLKYFRHYKKEHVKDDKKRHNVKSRINPLEYKSSRYR